MTTSFNIILCSVSVYPNAIHTVRFMERLYALTCPLTWQAYSVVQLSMGFNAQREKWESHHRNLTFTLEFAAQIVLIFSDTTKLAPSPSPPQSSTMSNFPEEVKFKCNWNLLGSVNYNFHLLRSISRNGFLSGGEVQG